MKRTYLLLYFCSLTFLFLLSLAQKSPGYMDAEYYYMGAMRLFRGEGFTEDILWNFLDVPNSLPRPSHTYWMPLTSIIAYLGMVIVGREGFESAQWIFILIAAWVPVVTAKLSYSMIGDKRMACFAGVMALFPFMYFPYLTTTDNFGISMLLGGIFLLAFPDPIHDKPERRDDIGFFAIGLIAGLMQLSRNEGIIWLVLAFVGIWSVCRRMSLAHRLIPLLLAGSGYLVVMFPWFLRNLYVLGSPLPAVTMRALWLLDYNELFIYPSEQLTFQRTMSAGLGYLAGLRLASGWQNLQTLLVIQGQIVLTPLMALGWWHKRQNLRLRIGFGGWILAFALMTLVFPVQGSRGGYFHASAAFQPLLWSVAPYGLLVFIQWGVKQRGWEQRQAKMFFSLALVLTLLLLTAFAVVHRVFGGQISDPLWERNHRVYSQVEQILLERGVQPNEAVMVNDAPGYYIFSNRRAISIPYGDEHIVTEVLKRWQVKFLILEFDQIPGMSLYSAPSDTHELHYLFSSDGARIYLFCPEGNCDE